MWDPITPAIAAELLSGLPVRWWICGGYAIDAFVGRALREHGDFDVGVLRRDQLAVQEHLRDWDLQAADPPGTLRPWAPGEFLGEHVHTAWARRARGKPWEVQVMFDEALDGDWTFRRDPRVRRKVEFLTWEKDGLRFLAPEVQLLYKSKGLREKDHADFDAAELLLSGEQREWLRQALETVDPGHTWLATLSARRTSP